MSDTSPRHRVYDPYERAIPILKHVAAALATLIVVVGGGTVITGQLVGRPAVNAALPAPPTHAVSPVLPDLASASPAATPDAPVLPPVVASAPDPAPAEPAAPMIVPDPTPAAIAQQAIPAPALPPAPIVIVQPPQPQLQYIQLPPQLSPYSAPAWHDRNGNTKDSPYFDGSSRYYPQRSTGNVPPLISIGH